MAVESHSVSYNPSYKRFFTVVLENQDYDDVMNNNFMGNILASKGMLLTNFLAHTHPSQPNYIYMIAGSRMGVFLGLKRDLNGESIVDLLETKGVSWKTYQEQYPGNCFEGDFGSYRRKHNPFISFNNIRNNKEWCSKIVNSDQLYVDIENENVPEYVFYTPDMDNNGHDTSLDYAARWLEKFITPLLNNSYFNDTLFFITYDESKNYFKRNQIFSLLIGPGITPGSKDNTRYGFENILATIEDRWALGNMDRDDAFAYKLNLKH
jgi:acid phosphatase